MEKNFFHFYCALAILLAAQPTTAATPPPGEPVIQYVEAVAPISGDAVQVRWTKWWGAPGNHWRLLHNGSVVCEGPAAPASPPEAAQSGDCRTHLLPGNNQLQAQLCRDGRCSSSALYRIEVPQLPAISMPAVWDAATVYLAGHYAGYQGRIYRANYWTRGNAPNNSPAWTLVATPSLQSAQASPTPWKYGASAAYSIVFDDYCAWANDNGLLLGEGELAARGLVGAFGVIAGYCGDPAWSTHWPNLRDFITRGHEVFNHSWDHGHPLNAPWASTPWGGNALEIRQSTQKIADMLDGYPVSFFGFPFDAASDEQLQYLRDMPQFLGTRAPNYWQASGVNAADFPDPFRIRFQVYARADQGPGNPASLDNLLDATLAQGGWSLRVFHSVEDMYYESVPLADYQRHLDRVKALTDQNQLWVGTISEVLRYRFARNTCQPRPAQPVARGTLIAFENASAECSRYATALTLEISGALRPFAAVQADRTVPVTDLGDGRYRFSVNPLKGSVLLY
ncbi:MAG: hypothetical protein JNN30_20325 [Rhodanobacteraceae bacterium]|nr:hypothetical protein [Rhodanobacteraceae bacterium]